jgi:hypothetical protein
MPQFAVSVLVFTQAAEHCVLGAAHVAEQVPEEQNGAVVGQAMPQAPQFVALLARSTQVPEQVIGRVPVVHVAPVLPLTPVVPALPGEPAPPGTEPAGGLEEVPQPKNMSGAAAKREAQRSRVRMPKTWHRFHNIPSKKIAC